MLVVPRCEAMMAGQVASDSLPLAKAGPHSDSRTSTPYYEGVCRVSPQKNVEALASYSVHPSLGASAQTVISQVSPEYENYRQVASMIASS